MLNKKMIDLGLNRSAIRELFEYGNMKKQEIGEDLVFDFSIGNPSTKTPDIVTDTLVKLLNEEDSVKLHSYTTAAGLFETRKAISDYLNKTYHTDTDPALMYLTLGASAALTISLNALVSSSDDEVIVIAPFFPEYKVFIEKAGAKMVVSNSRKDNLLPDLEDLKNKINKDTKALIINYPNNPTGVIIGKDELKELTNLLKEKEKEYNHPIYLISDEPYRELIYADKEYQFVTNYYDDSIVCYSFSKSISLPGERIGYVLVNKTCVDAKLVYAALCGSARSLGFVCPTSLFQYLIPHILGYTSDLTVYKENRDILYNALTSFGYEVIKPEGAFYMFVKALSSDAEKFSNYAKEKYNLLIVPSDSFGYKGFLRISYCVDQEMIKRSLKYFELLKKDYE